VHIVYQSFMGRFSDSPRALYEALADRPGTTHTWLVDPAHAAGFPDDVDGASLAGPEARHALESADLVVAGTHTELEWDKRPGARYLQTWHGTPLKRIHYDVLFAPPGRLDWLDQDVARWDLLLSPNRDSTPRLRKAFGFTGPVWETGYPRNDLLLSPDASRVRIQVRDALGIGDDVRTVLYAPTFRDDEWASDSREVPMALDLVDLVKTLDTSGVEHRVLLRRHNMMTERSHPGLSSGVTDVSWFPDVRHLHLAADVLVTDYSSLMFDWVLTGKPLVYYDYDLDRFRSEIRGFYFDLLPEAPGPVVTTPDELARAVLDPGDHSAAYHAFRSRYGHLEDGHATERVIERLGLA
jgi:CDP-glycerol glycerophosphotransferase